MLGFFCMPRFSLPSSVVLVFLVVCMCWVSEIVLCQCTTVLVILHFVMQKVGPWIPDEDLHGLGIEFFRC
jgi:hypothetical protein